MAWARSPAALFGALLPLGALLGVALYCLWPRLDHPSIHRWDEGIHQIATRQLHDTGVPMVYANPVFDLPFTEWPEPHIFLHKPTLPFALGALLMFIVGVTPFALRLVSFAAAFAAAASLYLFGRRVVGAALALALAAAFLCLPFGYMLAQGYQFGDVTDTSLLGFVALSVWVLSLAAERDSARLAATGGALCGCAFLCKSALALLPLGVAGALVALGVVGLGPRVRLRVFLWFLAAVIVVALPWNLYTALKWPDLFRWEAKYTLAFLGDQTREWAKPIYGIFTDVHKAEFSPWPPAIFPLAGLWLLWAAFRRRTLHLWILCLWLWGEWVPLTFATVKVPAHVWGAAPAALLAVGLLLRDSLSRPLLACVALAGLASGLGQPVLSTPIMEHPTKGVPRLTWEFLPPGLQIHRHPGLAEGLAVGLLVLLLVLGAWGAARWGRRWTRVLGRALGGAALVCACWFGFVQSSKGLELTETKHKDFEVDAFGQDIGPALEAALPKNAVLFVSTRDPSCCLATQSLMFYSGIGAYGAREEWVQLARLEGFHPYLVSGISQPFERVAAVPGNSWLQAYDLDSPRVAPVPLPEDVRPLDQRIGAVDVLGIAVSHADAVRDRYLFYLRSQTLTSQTSVTFYLDDGSQEHQTIARRRALDWPLSSSKKLHTPAKILREDEPPPPPPKEAKFDWITDPGVASWYTLEVAGPPRSRLKRLQLLGTDVPLP